MIYYDWGGGIMGYVLGDSRFPRNLINGVR